MNNWHEIFDFIAKRRGRGVTPFCIIFLSFLHTKGKTEEDAYGGF